MKTFIYGLVLLLTVAVAGAFLFPGLASSLATLAGPARAGLRQGVDVATVIALLAASLSVLVVLTLIAGRIQAHRDRVRWRRTRGTRRVASAPIRNLREIALTPSEMVLVDGARYAKRVRRHGTLLLDGTTRVSSDLLISALTAALVAWERRGAIKFEVGDWEDQSGRVRPRLLAIPTGARVEWPADTIEGRLAIDHARPVDDIVAEWLAWGSPSPMDRGLEKARILLALRGVAAVDFEPWTGYTYQWSTPPSEPDVAAATASAAEQLAGFRDAHPDLEARLRDAVRAGIKSRRLRDDAPAVDPWLDEAEERRAPYVALAASSDALSTGVAFHAVRSLLLVHFALILALSIEQLVAASVVTLAATAGYLIEWRVRSPGRPRRQVLLHIGYGMPTVVLAAAVVLAIFSASLLLGLLVTAVAGLATLSRALRGRVRAHVTALVTSPAPVEPAAPSEPPAAAAPQAHDVGGLRVVFLDPDELPPASAEARSRLEAIERRGPAIRDVYARALLFLCTATTALEVLPWALGWAPGAAGFVLENGTLWTPGEPASPRGVLIAYGLTVALLLFRGPLTETLRSGFVRYRRDHDASTGRPLKVYGGAWRFGIEPIRPIGVPLLTAVWFYWALGLIGPSARAAAPWQYPLFALSLAIPVAYLVWLREERARVERRYPVHPPLNLLALRVFGSTDLDDYVGLIDRWHWLGTMHMLDGPDSGGTGLRELVRYLSGTTEREIVKSDAELAAALGTFHDRRDGQLRFAWNSLQCDDRTWRAALDRMLTRAHVVVMDLSGFSRANRGCAYEIGRLIDVVPLSRFVLLVNHDTDVEALEEIIEAAWRSRAPDSPNASLESPELRLFSIGGRAVRRPDESQTAYVRRLRERIDRTRLVAMLCDAALGTPDAAARLRAPETVAWGAPGVPFLIRRVGLAIAAVYLLFAVLTSGFTLTAERAAPGTPPPASGEATE